MARRPIDPRAVSRATSGALKLQPISDDTAARLECARCPDCGAPVHQARIPGGGKATVNPKVFCAVGAHWTGCMEDCAFDATAGDMHPELPKI